MKYKIEDITDGDVVLIEGWEGSYEVLSHYQSEESVPRLVVQPTEGDTKPRYFPSISQVTMILYNVNDRVSQTEEQYSTSHYDTYYTITEEDIQQGRIKMDAYFVAKVWKTGSRDDSGALWHSLKTIARFGEKNSVEREIKALYNQAKALGRIYGVELE